jgi:hypothetical protein
LPGGAAYQQCAYSLGNLRTPGVVRRRDVRNRKPVLRGLAGLPAWVNPRFRLRPADRHLDPRNGNGNGCTMVALFVAGAWLISIVATYLAKESGKRTWAKRPQRTPRSSSPAPGNLGRRMPPALHHMARAAATAAARAMCCGRADWIPGLSVWRSRRTPASRLPRRAHLRLPMRRVPGPWWRSRRARIPSLRRRP